ncbi:hypothetical protein [Actinocorallia longicatena]|uniref:Transposase n=1 Tax=Actinocorallia longicatena TaxID=111803 RepID=A0ABP6QIC3_9ACTN
MSTSTQPFKSALRLQAEAQGKAEGKAEGEVEALLIVLEGREVEISDEARSRIMGCSDTEQLKVWLHRALRVTTTDELFAS